MTSPRVLDVGQCDYDHGNISTLLRTQFGAEVVRAQTAEAALSHLRQGSFSLMLVNRLFDQDGDSGLELIKKVKQEQKLGVPVMLVSNFEDAQSQAVAVGAEPGFGKAALKAPPTLEKLAAHLGGRA